MTKIDNHTQIIIDRYAKDQSDGIPKTDRNYLISRYLNNVMSLSELNDKVMLEIGAGCSQYANIFLDTGLKKYIANDLIESRLKQSRSSDPRYEEHLGNFLDIDKDIKVDFIFASLTMMFVVPMFDEFVKKIDDILMNGGVFISIDPNYICPLSVYRRYRDKVNNPAKIFNPFNYAKLFERMGYKVEILKPFSGPYPFLGGTWLTGTSFCMRVKKL